ncbi:MAG TPA: hypothetical protein VG125_18950, partial [Pirellulales bacterium]|nr:hypothetical protein [Pirellulales bacterium]
MGIQQALGLCCHSQFLHQTLTQPGHNMGLALLELMRRIGIAGHEAASPVSCWLMKIEIALHGGAGLSRDGPSRDFPMFEIRNRKTGAVLVRVDAPRLA